MLMTQTQATESPTSTAVQSWTCDDIIQSQIAFSGWENIKQTIAGYDAMFAEAATKADAGEPAIVYTGHQARTSRNSVQATTCFGSVNDVIDDSNPLGAEGGEGYDQGLAPHQSVQISAQVPRTACASSDGSLLTFRCLRTTIGEANPAAAKLLELFKMSVIDVSLMNVEMAEGTAVLDLAQGWIDDNRAQVDEWLEAARQHLIVQTDEWFGRPFGAGNSRLRGNNSKSSDCQAMEHLTGCS